jgi:hypothetical protein
MTSAVLLHINYHDYCQQPYKQCFIFFITSEWQDKLECLSLASLSGLVQCNTGLMEPFISYKKVKCCDQGSRGRIYIASFSSKLLNGQNKLECLSLASLSGLVKCNALV